MWKAKKIQKEAKRFGVSVEDLANAVSVVQANRVRKTYDAQHYDGLIVEDTPQLWEAAERVADFFETQK